MPRQLQDSRSQEESKHADEAMPALVGQGRRPQQVTLEMLFELVMELQQEVRELRQELHTKAQKDQQASPEHRIQVYFRDGAEPQARELLASALREYLAPDARLGDPVVGFGVVSERPWNALVLLSREVVKPRLAKILKTGLAAAKCAELSTVKPFPHTQLFGMPVADRQEIALALLPRMLRGRQPQDRDQSSIISRHSLLEQ